MQRPAHDRLFRLSRSLGLDPHPNLGNAARAPAPFGHPRRVNGRRATGTRQGTILLATATSLLTALLAAPAPGQGMAPGNPVGAPPSGSAGPTAVVIPPIDAEVIWKRLVDVVDDYFKIESEQRVVFADGVPTEGRIDTFPQTGATLFEPWRGDSVGFRERLESTLQSIRRTSTVRLSPDPAGWRLEVSVLKELENLPRPMQATTGGASFRNDDSLYRYGSPLPTLGEQIGEQPRPVANPTRNAGWIPIGKDQLLERRIIDKTLAALGVSASSGRPYYQPPEGGLPGVVTAPTPGGLLLPPPQMIPAEQLPPGAVIAPGPPIPIESLPPPR
jgi:hypothetical protein